MQGEQNIRSDLIPADGQSVDSGHGVVHPKTDAVSGNFVAASTRLWRTWGQRYDALTTSGRRRRARAMAPEAVR